MSDNHPADPTVASAEPAAQSPQLTREESGASGGLTITSPPVAQRPPIWRQLLEHWLIGVFLGVLVALSLAAMARISPLRLMDWLGADAVAESAARAGAADQGWTPRIVFLSIDDADAAMRGWHARTGIQARVNISKLIGQVRQSGAKLVVLDTVFEPLSVSPHCDDAGCPRHPAGLSDVAAVLFVLLSLWSSLGKAETWDASSSAAS
jgi:hypothetical protein